MLDTSSHISIRQGSEKSFGIVLSVVFLIIALYPLTYSVYPHFWALAVAVILLLLAFIKPIALKVLNRLWFRFGLLLGAIVAPLLIVMVFLITVLPTGIIMRLLGKDLLRLKLDKKAKSYWIIRDEQLGSMKNQF